jgi:hypothetical protein
MYMAALEFLEDERDSWRPYESLGKLTDDQLRRTTDPDAPGHGWSGRDLLVHMLAWRQISLDVARDLALGETSATWRRVTDEWNAGGDALNARLFEEWRDVPIEEVRRRSDTLPGELRGYLTVVPETRWIKDAGIQGFLAESTLEHDQEHMSDLQAILALAGR